MKRLLIGWELGGNHGHLTTCLHVTNALRASYDVVFAVRDVRGASEILGDAAFSYVQAPVPMFRKSRARPAANYSEMLLGEGYADFDLLRGLVHAWLTLLKRLEIDLVLVDHAPTALLACTIADIPAINIGNGFATPPSVFPMPCMRTWEDIPEERLKRADAAVNEQISKVARSFSYTSDLALAELFGGENLLTCLPELDHYPQRSGGTYVGAIFSQPRTQRVDWQGTGEGRVLAYLRPGVPGFLNAMTVLRECRAEVVARIPGITRAQARKLAGPRLRIVLSPTDFNHLLQDANVMVSYGSSGVVTESLLRGVPQLILAKVVEQHMLALRVAEWGGVAAREDRSAERLSADLSALLNDQECRRSVQDFAQRNQEYSPENAVEKIASTVKAILS
ncbi:glycosyltransferase [Oceanidesulfovibrio marinus]|uniref:UDP-glucuronosyltransferase n=1 Tax=Oceanidesulfovibrio marinus TaxID=370038 RepID=A0ABX6NBP7_9BACT|nr:nucleotide disphospho-sugar-binding domain-containing protein [Oceanidesulfovibrio marinus]QJT08012.1 UDP-glucuronosyltransferase [Oceanidesulfovibrio marinus]